MQDEKRATLERAAERLWRLDFYPRPVRMRRVHSVVCPWLFRLPWFRKFDGYATHLVLLFRSKDWATDEDLVTHELCHVWQMQHRPLAMPLSFLVRGYEGNRYEEEAWDAVEVTRRTRIGVLLHGTALMHHTAVAVPREGRVEQVRRGDPEVHEFATYLPTPGTVEKLRHWAASAQIVYLSTHDDRAGLEADASVLRAHEFPRGRLLRAADVLDLLPDVIVEDDCESIGGETHMTWPQLPPDVRGRVRSVVVREFEGLGALPDELGERL